jgi:AcrR family transcriptional regulator
MNTQANSNDPKAPSITSRSKGPRTKRGMRSYTALVFAAREVFERDGYIDARISDISKAAGMASGSFYTYFESKEEVLAAVVNAVQEDMLHPHLGTSGQKVNARESIEKANREYLLAYQHNARLMSVFEQVAQVDENFRELRRKRGEAFGKRNARFIRRLQEQGDADPNMDPLIAAYALSAMVGRMAYQVFVIGESIAFEELLLILNRLWINALQINPDANLTAVDSQETGTEFSAVG